MASKEVKGYQAGGAAAPASSSKPVKAGAGGVLAAIGRFFSPPPASGAAAPAPAPAATATTRLVLKPSNSYGTRK